MPQGHVEGGEPERHKNLIEKLIDICSGDGEMTGGRFEN